MDGQELIWVDKEFAEKWKKLKADGSVEQQQAAFNEYMAKVSKDVRDDYEAQLSSLEEDAAMFRGLMLKVRQEFKKSADEHLAASYDLWEKFQAEKPETDKKILSLVESLRPLKAELKQINDLVGSLNTHAIDRVIESIRALSGLCGEKQRMVEFLIHNFGKAEQ